MNNKHLIKQLEKALKALQSIKPYNLKDADNNRTDKACVIIIDLLIELKEETK